MVCLDPNPDSRSRSGYTDPMESGCNLHPDSKHWL